MRHSIPTQKGITPMIALILIVVISTTGLGIVSFYNHAITKAERVEKENDALLKANSEQLTENFQLRQRNVHLQQLLVARESKRQVAAEIERKIDDYLNKAKRNDPKVKEWADTPVPASILSGLRLESNSANSR